MKDRIVFKTTINDMVSIPITCLTKVLGDKELYSIYDETVWHIHKDYISIVDKELFPAEDII